MILFFFVCFVFMSGTKFHLLRASAHPALEVSEDQTALHYSHSSAGNTQWAPVCLWHASLSHFGRTACRLFSSFFSRCPSVLGELLPLQGRYYWEAVVSGSTAYRLGVTYSMADRNSPVGENNLSWCLQCVPAPSGYVQEKKRVILTLRSDPRRGLGHCRIGQHLGFRSSWKINSHFSDFLLFYQ